jgi:AraC family transcriptional activator of pobA
LDYSDRLWADAKLPILDIEQFPSKSFAHDFYANDLATHLETNHKAITILHKDNFFLTVLFAHGTGLNEVDFERYEIKPGSVFMLNPTQTHHWELADDIDRFLFFHTQVFYDLNNSAQTITNFPFYYSLQNSPCLNLNPEQHEKILPYFRMIPQKARSEEVLKQQRLCSLIDLV